MTNREIVLGPALPARLGELVAIVIDHGGLEQSEALVAYLSLLLDIPVEALIHYGTSSDSNEANPTDVDILVLAGESVVGGVWGTAGVVSIDMPVAGLEDSLNADPSAWSHVADGRVLLDRTGKVTEWLERLRNWRTSEGGIRPRSNLVRDRVWAQRMVDRVRAAGDDPVRRTVLEASLVAALPELYAQSRQRPSMSMKQWLREVRANDPKLAILLDDYARDRAAGPDRLTSLLDHLFAKSAM